MLKETNSFIVVPSSDELRRKPLATGDFHRVTNETSKGSYARNPAAAERATLKKPINRPVSNPEPVIAVVRPKRKHAERSAAPVDDGEQIEEHAISGPQVVAESLARGKRADVDDGKAGVPPTMRVETSAARRAKASFINPPKEDSLAYHQYCYVQNSKKIDAWTDNSHSVAEAK